MSVPTFEELREALKCPPKIVVPLMINGRPKSSYHQHGGNFSGKKNRKPLKPPHYGSKWDR